jgi:N,N-dimethylformamidase
VIELRRAEGGIRLWAAEPGEYYHSFDGGYGGLWRRNGRPPNLLSGVGFSAQGGFVGTYYRRQAGSFDPRAAFIFRGIPDDALIGDFGYVGGGAAGFEIDRADIALGTPPHALILATSEAHDRTYEQVNEERMAVVPMQPESEIIRSDMLFFETPAGGAVFSVGSITFCGSLACNRYRNNVAQLVTNVLTRFLAEERFAVTP